MIRSMTRRAGLWRETRAQSLIEVALMLPIFVLLLCYSVEFGYFFVAAASLSSSARSAAVYATQGYSSPAQAALPVLGSAGVARSVAGVAFGNMSGFASSATTTAVQLCTNSNGTIACSSTGVAGMILGSYVPDVDPEPGTFQLARVDVVYTVKPPVPMTFFGVSLMPTLNFHRMAEMRVIN